MRSELSQSNVFRHTHTHPPGRKMMFVYFFPSFSSRVLRDATRVQAPCCRSGFGWLMSEIYNCTWVRTWQIFPEGMQLRCFYTRCEQDQNKQIAVGSLNKSNRDDLSTWRHHNKITSQDRTELINVLYNYLCVWRHEKTHAPAHTRTHTCTRAHNVIVLCLWLSHECFPSIISCALCAS